MPLILIMVYAFSALSFAGWGDNAPIAINPGADGGTNGHYNSGGSRIVRMIEDNLDDKKKMQSEIADFITQVKAVL